MKKVLVSFILGIIVGYGIGYVVMQKELKMQEFYYVNQLEIQHCNDTEGVCD